MSARDTLHVDITPIREVHVDVNGRDLVAAAAGMDFVILRVTGLTAPSGRPVTRSIRLHTSLLQEKAIGWE